MRLFVALCVCVTVVFSCKCKTQTTKESFCAAQWVSHVRVKLRVSKQPLPEGSTRKGLNNIKYIVEHLHAFKLPTNTTELPQIVYTPSEAPACGLLIEAGREYLLAGQLINDKDLYTVLCGQVLLDNPSAETFENVLEWKNVPNALQNTLNTITC